jgi:hypothetical protein
MPINDNTPTVFDTFVSEITKGLDDILDTVRKDFNGPTEGFAEEEATNETEETPTTDDLTPDNLLNEAVRLLQLAEETAEQANLVSGTYVTLADRYIYLAENV